MIRAEEPLYRIQLLGQLEIRQNGKLLNAARRELKWHKALASLILARGETVPDYELIQITGIDPGENAKHSLKLMIHKIRKLMPGEPAENGFCINRMPGGYAWNMDFDARVDLFEAEALCSRITSAMRFTRNMRMDIPALIGLFSGCLLREMEDEPWVELAQYRLKTRYTAAMSWLLAQMWRADAIDQIILTCLHGLAKDAKEPMFSEYLRRAKSVAHQRAADELIGGSQGAGAAGR